MRLPNHNRWHFDRAPTDRLRCRTFLGTSVTKHAVRILEAPPEYQFSNYPTGNSWVCWKIIMYTHNGFEWNNVPAMYRIFHLTRANAILNYNQTNVFLNIRTYSRLSSTDIDTRITWINEINDWLLNETPSARIRDVGLFFIFMLIYHKRCYVKQFMPS